MLRLKCSTKRKLVRYKHDVEESCSLAAAGCSGMFGNSRGQLPSARTGT